eukprot:Awhi_evm1s14862
MNSSLPHPTPCTFEESDVQIFHGEWDEEGVYFYQAYNDDIADWALQHQKFGGPSFNVTRMTWIKPSFGWVLYRSGYGKKHNQTRVLKIKLSHSSVAELLSKCTCTGGGGANGRIQWDPARDMLRSDDRKEPNKMQKTRAIQIGIKGKISELYVDSIVSIQDVSQLAHRVHEAHKEKSLKKLKIKMNELLLDLPNERAYMPLCSNDVLERLGMLPGETAKAMKAIGLGRNAHELL